MMSRSLTRSPKKVEARRTAICLMTLIVTTPMAATAGAGEDAAPPPLLMLRDRFANEPSVYELQRAAVRVAEVQPERARSWLRRARAAALFPTVHVGVGRGLGEFSRDSSDHLYYSTSDNWRFEIDATWSLDRLVFDRNELWASREERRLVAHREELLTRVAKLYYDRRRLQIDALASPDAPTALDRALEIDELTAVLDGLTDGALSRGKRNR
jgi:hypothetical protein